MKKLLVAAIVVLMASPAFAAIQNVKVSGDITSTYLDRSDFDLGLNGPVGLAGTTQNPTLPEGLKHQSIFLTQTRLRVDADLSDNVSTTVGLINERAWNGDNTVYGYSQDTDVELYLANVTMRELLYSPLTVTVGRQIFNYGNGLILGEGGVNNQSSGNLKYIAQDFGMGTAEDGIKAVLDYKPLTIDLIYFKNDQTPRSIMGAGHLTSGQSSEVFGYNANYQLSDPWNTVVEQYMFARINGSGYDNWTITTTTNPSPDLGKGDKLYVPGLRVSTNPVKGLNVQGEVAVQTGNQVVAANGGVESEQRDAMAAQLLASYALPVLEKYKPTVNASYTYVSGDKMSDTNAILGAKDAKHFTAWDPMFENQGAGTIYNALYPLSDMNIIALGASANPLEDVTTSLTWSNLWSAEKLDGNNPLAIYQPNDGAYAIAPVTTSELSPKKDNRGLGNEYDVNLTYNYTEDVAFGVSLGWYVPGSAFIVANRDTASQAVADVAVKF